MNSTDAILANHRHYTTVTLDMGYTLVNLIGGFDREMLALAARYGRQITRDDMRAAMRLVWDQQLEIDARTTWEPSVAADAANALDIDRRACLNLGLGDPQAHAEANAIARRIFRDPASFRIFPEVFPTLEALRGLGLKLGIVSNWDWWLSDLCATLGLSPYFDFIISSSRIGAAKPNPVIFRAALELAESHPDQVLHVGDSLQADVLGAQRAGITGVLVDRSGALGKSNGYPVISALDQILPLVTRQVTDEKLSRGLG